jgi:predicted kinase/histidinol phosphatase-like enzyme
MRKNLIKLLVGIPASGKSTWKKKFLLNNSGWVAVSRDDYRLMLDGSQIMDFKGEKLITELVNNAIALAVKSKYNVLIDQTNVNLKYLNEMVAFCEKLADVEFQIFDITEKVSVERDAARDAKVGAEVIKKMYKNYLNLFNSNFDFSTRKRKAHIATNVKWKRNGNLPNAIIFDIDGTLAHMQGKRGTFDWNRVNLDVVDEKVRETLKAYKKANYKIIVVTGRDGTSKDMTAQWLRDNKIEFDVLHTKPENDFRKDYITKTEIYNSQIKPFYNVLAAYDDRKQAVNMWRGLGIKCYQVEDGDF